MDVIRWLKSFVVVEELEEEQEQGDTEEIIKPVQKSHTDKRIVVFEPKNYKEAMEIADAILDKNDAVINLKRLDEQSRQRLTDFLCGVTYQTECEINFTGNEVLICYWKTQKK